MSTKNKKKVSWNLKDNNVRRYNIYISDSLGCDYENNLDNDGGTYPTLDEAIEQAELFKSSMTYISISDGYDELWSWSISDDKDEQIKELTNEIVNLKDINADLRNKIKTIKTENYRLREIIIERD